MVYNPFKYTQPKMLYVPDAFGRVGNGISTGRWVIDPNADPFGHRYREDLVEEEFDFSDPFHPSGSIGDRGKNDRNDIANLEGLLRLTGDMDLSRTDGPTGYYGSRLDEAIKRFQKRKGLSVNGDVNPGGQTMRALKIELARLARSPSARSDLSPAETGYLNQITGLNSRGIPRRPPGIQDHLHRPLDGDPRDHARILPAYLDDEPAFTNYASSRRTLSAAASDGSDDQGEKKGKYIWRTQGDGKVRPEHAERDGQEFDWDAPPPGGHPGEAPNCRCWPENVKDSRACAEAKVDVINAEAALERARAEETEAEQKVAEAEAAHRAAEDRRFSTGGSVPSLDVASKQILKRVLGWVGIGYDIYKLGEAEYDYHITWDAWNLATKELKAARKSVQAADQRLAEARQAKKVACG